MDKILSEGGCIIVDFHSDTKYDNKPIWTDTGHYVLFYSGNQNDGYRVLDPNGGHESGSQGISEWAPYTEHVFTKENMTPCYYYYTVKKK